MRLRLPGTVKRLNFLVNSSYETSVSFVIELPAAAAGDGTDT
jgi:hypothetical protein